MEITYTDKINAIRECLVEYTTPLYVCGVLNDVVVDSLTIIHANMPKEELIIIGNNYPDWIKKVKANGEGKNTLLIKDFDKISYDDQRLFLDIICNNSVSGEKLPNNLKIIINSSEKCNLIPEIREVIQFFEI